MNQEAVPQKAHFRPDEAASLLGVCRRTIFRMLADGRLSPVKKGEGGPLWVSRAEIIERLTKKDAP